MSRFSNMRNSRFASWSSWICLFTSSSALAERISECVFSAFDPTPSQRPCPTSSEHLLFPLHWSWLHPVSEDQDFWWIAKLWWDGLVHGSNASLAPASCRTTKLSFQTCGLRLTEHDWTMSHQIIASLDVYCLQATETFFFGLSHYDTTGSPPVRTTSIIYINLSESLQSLEGIVTFTMQRPGLLSKFLQLCCLQFRSLLSGETRHLGEHSPTWYSKLATLALSKINNHTAAASFPLSWNPGNRPCCYSKGWRVILSNLYFAKVRRCSEMMWHEFTLRSGVQYLKRSWNYPPWLLVIGSPRFFQRLQLLPQLVRLCSCFCFCGFWCIACLQWRLASRWDPCYCWVDAV